MCDESGIICRSLVRNTKKHLRGVEANVYCTNLKYAIPHAPCTLIRGWCELCMIDLDLLTLCIDMMSL